MNLEKKISISVLSLLLLVIIGSLFFSPFISDQAFGVLTLITGMLIGKLAYEK